MSNITINNYGTVNIYNYDSVEDARDNLLTKMYHARNKNTMGGYEAWLQLLDWYYMGSYNKMIEFIESCHGSGGKTRNECLSYLYTIIGGIK